MNKKIILSILTLLLCITAQAQTWNIGTPTATNVTATLDAEGTLTISGTGAMRNFTSTSNRPPWSSRRNDIRTVVVQDGVTNISDFAFSSSTNLTNVVVGNNVTSIGRNAFSDTNLTSIVIPNALTSIGDYAFRNTGLTSIVIPNSVISIGHSAFANTNLTCVVIGVV